MTTKQLPGSVYAPDGSLYAVLTDGNGNLVNASDATLTVGTTAVSGATNGYVLYNNNGILGAESVSGVGTVTSVAMTVPSILSVSGSPITTAGTLAVTLATETANLVFAGPTTGSAATPTFRSLVAADIPSLSGSYLPLAGGILTGQQSWNEATTVASASSVTLDDLNVEANTTTITGSTNITTPAGFNKISVYTPTFTSSSAVTISNAASLYIANAPAAAGSVTIKQPYSLFTGGGDVFFTGGNETNEFVNFLNPGGGGGENSTLVAQRNVTSTWSDSMWAMYADIQATASASSGGTVGSIGGFSSNVSTPVGSTNAISFLLGGTYRTSHQGTGTISAYLAGTNIAAGNLAAATVAAMYGLNVKNFGNSGGGTVTTSHMIDLAQPAGATTGLTSVWTNLAGIHISNMNPTGAGTNTLTNVPVALLIDSQTATGAYAIQQNGSGLNLFAGASTFSTSVTIGAGSAITSSGAGGALGSNAFTSTAYAPLASPTFTGTVTMPDSSTITSSGQGSIPFMGIGQSVPSTYVLGVTGTTQTGSNANGAVNIAQTWNTSGGPTALAVSVTNTASTGGMLLNLSAGSAGTTTEFSVDSGGNILAAGNISTKGNAAIFGLRNGATSISSPASNQLQFGLAASGTPAAQVLSFQSGSGSNIAGQNATVIGSLGTGNAASGDILVQTGGAVAGSGTTAATATTALRIKGVTQQTNFLGIISPQNSFTPTAGSGAASVSGNDQAFVVTTGTAQTSVTVNFGHTWNTAPVCVVSSNSTASVVDITSVSTTSITFGASVALTGGLLYVLCFGT